MKSEYRPKTEDKSVEAPLDDKVEDEKPKMKTQPVCLVFCPAESSRLTGICPSMLEGGDDERSHYGRLKRYKICEARG